MSDLTAHIDQEVRDTWQRLADVSPAPRIVAERKHPDRKNLSLKQRKADLVQA